MVSDFIIDEVYKFLSKYFKGREVGGVSTNIKCKIPECGDVERAFGAGFFLGIVWLIDLI